MNLLELLTSPDETNRRKGLDFYVDTRARWDTVKLEILLEVLDQETNIDKLKQYLRNLNTYCEKELRPLYGLMMTEKRL